MLAVAVTYLLGVFWVTIGAMKFVAPAVKDVLVLAVHLGVAPKLARVAYFGLAGAEVLVGVTILVPRARRLGLRAGFVLAGVLGLGWALLTPTHAVCGCLGTFADLSVPARGLLIGGPLLLAGLLSHPRSGACPRRGGSAGIGNISKGEALTRGETAPARGSAPR